MENNSMNYDVLHNFMEGMRSDYDNHAEGNKSYTKGVNGRLFFENGVIAYTSLKGTKKVYENSNIKRYLGFYAFKDELILFTKVDSASVDPTIVCELHDSVVVSNGALSSLTDTITNTDFFTTNIEATEVEYCFPSEPIDENDFNQSQSDVQDQTNITDFGDLFLNMPLLPLQYCPVNVNDIPVNNESYSDAIWSFKYNDSGNLVAKLLYGGNLNWSWDAKICAVGIDENVFRKMVYFTDYENAFMFINIKDGKLKYRSAQELTVSVNGTLLNPRIVEKKTNGVLKAMAVVYLYRLVSDNGQVSDFSPASEMIYINKDDGDYKFSGGGISESTNKSIVVSAIVPDYKNFGEIQMIAVEFEAALVPTTIRMIGRKAVSFYNQFEHFGSEPEFIDNITLADIFKNSIRWKYCSDLLIKNNKLIPVGLRNEPSYVNSKNTDIDFGLHGFHHDNGLTHESLLNPDPVYYNYIDKDMNSSFMYVDKKIYRKIEVYGNFYVKLKNKQTGDVYTKTFNDMKAGYNDVTAEIYTWLSSLYAAFPSFMVNFPNLTFSMSDGKILFLPVVPGTPTDFYNYNLVFSTPQVILDYDNSLKKKTYSWPATTIEKNNRLVYGAVSNGWYSGNGVRVTMLTKSDLVLEKNTDWMSAGTPPLKIKEPTLLKGVMKGEIYRLGIQWFKNGNKVFATVLGDIKIPDIGQLKRELNADGSINYGAAYQNFTVKNNKMYAQRIELMFDVRIDCDLSKEVDAYQIVYVERTEENRTILAQGISAPLNRMNIFDKIYGSVTEFDEVLTNKWNLPYYGGPVIDYQGFLNYDKEPDNTTFASKTNGTERMTTHRKLFYFDAPDFIFEKVSDVNAESAYVDYLQTLGTDHDKHNIVGGYNRVTSNNNNASMGGSFVGTSITYADGTYSNGDVIAPFGSPKFSQKIPYNLLGKDEKERPAFVNVSVFSQVYKTKTSPAFTDAIVDDMFYNIDDAESANPGEVISAFRMNESFDISNNAAALGMQGYWWMLLARVPKNFQYNSFNVNNLAQGRSTLFIRTTENFFSNANIAQTPFIARSRRNFGTTEFNSSSFNALATDTHIVSNLRRKNQDSVYGGRSEYAYSANVYIAMSDVIPVIKNNVSSQKFNVQGDTYSTLFIRNKTSYVGAKTPELRGFYFNQAPNDTNYTQFKRYGAWAYAVVLETTVEPRLNYSEEFYRKTSGFNFSMSELLNSAYTQANNLQLSIPKPYKFQDDPNQESTVAVSETKLSGDYYDAFTVFKPNEFYELEKNKGAALNIIAQNDQVYVIQEEQTSLINIDERAFITPDNGGQAIQVAQGGGNSISGHQVISDYGTSIRRALIENSDFGFCFIDERKKEFVKIKDPLFLKNMLSLFMNVFFTENKIIDTEGYFDPKYKETNIRIRTKTGLAFVLSYNEVFKCFNGTVEIDNDIYPVFQEKVLAPYAMSAKLGQMNEGNFLEFFEETKKRMFMEVITVGEQAEKTKIEKGIAATLNINYPIKKVTFETSLGQSREILGTHPHYKIREGVHTLPALNQMDITDIRGEWIKVLLEMESIGNTEVKLFSIVNYLRNSYK